MGRCRLLYFVVHKNAIKCKKFIVLCVLCQYIHFFVFPKMA